MKKLLLGLGTLASVAAPVAAVVACGSSTPEAKFETATDAQKAAIQSVTTKISSVANLGGPTTTEISGNKVRYTFGAVPTAADASDDASTVTAKTYVVKKFTVDLESGKIIDAQAAEADGKFESIIDTREVKDAAGDITSASETAKTALEQANADAALAKAKLDGEAKVEAISGLSDADKNTAKAAITAATDQAGIDQAVNEAKASITPTHAQPQAGNTGNIVEKDQDAVNAEQLVINALTPVSIDKYDSAGDAPYGTLTNAIAAGLGLTSFTPKDGFTYSITDSTDSTVTITVGSEAHAAIEGTPVAITLVIKATPAVGTPGPAVGAGTGAAVADPALESAFEDDMEKVTATNTFFVVKQTPTNSHSYVFDATVKVGDTISYQSADWKAPVGTDIGTGYKWDYKVTAIDATAHTISLIETINHMGKTKPEPEVTWDTVAVTSGIVIDKDETGRFYYTEDEAKTMTEDLIKKTAKDETEVAAHAAVSDEVLEASWLAAVTATLA